jgi:antimicrobial peptide system SdpA family protein
LSTNVADEAKGRRRLGATALVWWGFLVIVFGYAVHGSMDGATAVELPLETQLNTVSYLPEGWKFFTRNAREEISLLYKQDESGHWMRADTGVNASAHNLFGLSRKGRNEGIESGFIITAIRPEFYEDCTGDADACLQNQRPKLRIGSGSRRPVFCGKLGVVVSQRVPWAWARSPKPPSMKSKAVVVEVTC